LPVRYGSLALLTFSTSALVLTMRASRTVPGPKYLTPTAVVTSEFLKFCISVAFYIKSRHEIPQDESCLGVHDSNHQTSTFRRVLKDIFSRKSGIVLLLIPSALYTITNNLQFIAASHLDVATYQILYQGKLITTALFAVIIMRQRLCLLKWLSIVILAVGISIISLPTDYGVDSNFGSSFSAKTTSTQLSSLSALLSRTYNQKTGYLAVAVACVLSGLSGVVFEFILKRYRLPHTVDAAVAEDMNDEKSETAANEVSTSVMWLRSTQLSINSMSLGLVGIALWHGQVILHNGFFAGYTPLVWLTVILQACVGIIVAIVISAADNVSKGFASSLSVVVSSIASYYIFHIVPTRNFLYGAVLVLLATHIYALPSSEEEDATRMEHETVVSDVELCDSGRKEVAVSDTAETSCLHGT